MKRPNTRERCPRKFMTSVAFQRCSSIRPRPVGFQQRRFLYHYRLPGIPLSLQSLMSPALDGNENKVVCVGGVRLSEATSILDKAIQESADPAMDGNKNKVVCAGGVRLSEASSYQSSCSGPSQPAGIHAPTPLSPAQRSGAQPGVEKQKPISFMRVKQLADRKRKSPEPGYTPGRCYQPKERCYHPKERCYYPKDRPLPEGNHAGGYEMCMKCGAIWEWIPIGSSSSSGKLTAKSPSCPPCSTMFHAAAASAHKAKKLAPVCPIHTDHKTLKAYEPMTGSWFYMCMAKSCDMMIKVTEEGFAKIKNVITLSSSDDEDW